VRRVCLACLFALSAALLPAAAGADVLPAPPAALHAVDPWGLQSLPPAPRVQPRRATPPALPTLPDEPAERSFSMGSVTEGRVPGSVAPAFPTPHLGVLPRQLSRGLTHGTVELVDLLTHAALEVGARWPDAVVWLGNVGRPGGGDIPWSVSHNSGRDADIAFPTTDPRGRPVMPPDLLAFDPQGRSRAYGGWYRLDAARTWALVEALVSHPTHRVQYLFASNPIRQRVLQHGRRIGADPAILARVEAVLRQPAGALPHDDHLHLRVYCSEADLGAGCEDSGPVHAWLPRYPDARAACASAALEALGSPDPGFRTAAALRLREVPSPRALPALREALDDPSPAVRGAVVEALAAQGAPRDLTRLLLHWEQEPDDEVRWRMLRALARRGGADVWAHLAWLAGRDEEVEVQGKRVPLRLVAIDGLAAADAPGALSLLPPLLTSDDAEVRDRTLRTLRRATNHDAWPVCPRSASAEALRDAVDAWARWLEAPPAGGRPAWLAAGWAAAGHAVEGGRPARWRALARAAGHPSAWVRWNAQRQLMEETGLWPDSLQWQPSEASLYWTRRVHRLTTR
jgi:murein endopeptidase